MRMFKSWRLGTVLGFPIEINLSFLILLGIVFIGFGGLLGVFVVGLAFASVVLHELGHAVVARMLHVPIAGIELGFFGGAAKMTGIPRRPNHEIAIAIAGPIVSLVLAGIGLGLGLAFHSQWLGLIGWINLVLAGFNLIPALPMDGGRILRAFLAKRTSYVRATDQSITVARFVAVGFAIFGLATGAYQLLLLAPFLWLMGTRERVMARMIQDRYGGYPGGGGGYHAEVLRHDDDDWRGPFGGGGGGMRRFTVVQRNGRVVIEAHD